MKESDRLKTELEALEQKSKELEREAEVVGDRVVARHGLVTA